jgi:hypothetical protein
MRRLAVLATLLAALPGAFPVLAQPIRLIPPSPQEQPAAAETPAAQPSAPATPAQTNTPPIGLPFGIGPSTGPNAGTRPTAPAMIESQTLQPPAAAPAPATAETPAGGKTPDFVIQPLKAPDASSAGLLDDSNGGLGSAMWQGSTRPQALQALGILPAPVTVTAARELQRRLLLTGAEIPPGNDGTPSILGLRVAQLLKLGRLAEAERLSPGSGPAAPKDAVFRELPFTLALLKNDTPRACELAAAGLRDDPAPLWQKATVFCRYLAKDLAGGDLALSLWRDSGVETDPAFSALANILRGDARAKLDSFGAPVTPLHFAMLRATGRPLPKDTLDQAAPAVLAAIAGHDKADAETRLTATERAVAAGALPAELLAEAYAAVEISDAQRTALTAAIGSGKEKSVRGAALLYQSARSTNEAKTRAELVRRAFEMALLRNTLPATAAVYRPLLVNLPPNEASIHTAPAVIRMALAAGDTGLARLWRNTLLALPPERDKAGEIVAEAWPLLLLAGEDGDWRDSRYEAWLATQSDLPAPERTARAATLLTLAEAAGIAVPAERWDSLLNAATASAGRAPPVALWRNLQRAANAKAKAETVALALAMLGGQAEAEGQALGAALVALRHVGLGAEVRRIALEVALLRGF